MAEDELHPFDDSEVSSVIRRLTNDREFLGFLAEYDSPKLYALIPPLVRALTRRKLGQILGHVTTIREFQAMVESYVRRIVETSMTSFDVEGMDRLDPDRAHVFVSNHRDIAGDSMLLNYALHLAGFETVRIAVGDNLVQKPFATDLMKLNKSFFIKRSGTTRREIYNALMESSRYMADSLAEGQSIWIAQASGRAKDGIDQTDPAVIKMLTMAYGKRPFAEILDALSIVPVSLSYEFDPCDVMKAVEVAAITEQGSYTKQPGEDLLSLARGLMGDKGRVSLVVCDELSGDLDSPAAVASAIDDAVLTNLQIFPINLAAVCALRDQEPDSPYAALQVASTSCAELESRLTTCAPEARPYLLRMYANPVLMRDLRNEQRQ